MDLNLDQLETLIGDLGIEISSQTAHHFLCYCPFHDNTDTPSFEIDKFQGLWLCFNEACGEKGNLNMLVSKLGGEEAKSFERTLALLTVNKKIDLDIDSEFNKIFGEEYNNVDWDKTMESLRVDYDNEIIKLKYLLERGFLPHTLKHFEIGFSEKKQRIVIPVRNENFKLVGVIGRAITDEKKPKYLYSDNLPKKGLLFNLCYAKAYKEVIVVEGSLDAIRVSQAGFPNVVAALGSGFSEQQAELVNKYFLDVIIFGDNDDAGRGLGEQIIDRCSKRNLYYAQYPEGIKDPGEMTDEQISWALRNKKDQVDVLFDRFFQ